ncbi:MAG: hypothetical protein AAFY99_03260 [Pseudomonadota bacterium]
MSKFARFLIVNALVGAFLGCVFVAGVLFTDTGGLGSLIMKSQQKMLVLTVIFVSTAINVGLMYMTTAIFLTPEDPSDS